MRPRIETDVRPARDGFVIFHDPTVSRLLDAKDHKVSNLKIDALKRLHFRYKPKGCEVPTIQEYKAFAAKAGVETILEFKVNGGTVWTSDMVRSVVMTMDGASTIFASPDVKVLRLVRAVKQDAHVLGFAGGGPVTDSQIKSMRDFGGSTSLSKHSNSWLDDRKSVTTAKNAGVEVVALRDGNLTDPSQSDDLRKIGVDRIIADIATRPKPKPKPKPKTKPTPTPNDRGPQGDKRPGSTM